MSGSSLVIGVPSKGRLQENTFAFFARAGMPLSQARGSRDYRGQIGGIAGAEIAFLSASDIAGELARGAIHLGVTGEDLLAEAVPDREEKIVMLTPLGFGHANVVVAVPEAWIDVRSMADVEDVAAAFHARHHRRMRVATKYINLTRRHFAQHGIVDYRIVESLGATEGAPAAGTAEMIVDITTTGATLAANGLKVLDDGTMLKSEANLVAAVAADWSPAAREAARQVLLRISAEETARTTREVRTRLDRPVDAAALAAFHAVLPYGAEAGEVILHCPAGQVGALADWLTRNGATTVTVSAQAYVFQAANPLFERLEHAAIKWKPVNRQSML
ncbi:MAG TPA: ATP phosphoribosyltransferase [Beijerinckiaceae bacterium]|nr:ATP phosphoribosyltransferase [Beijerinckiaceae bacterium]